MYSKRVRKEFYWQERDTAGLCSNLLISLSFIGQYGAMPKQLSQPANKSHKQCKRSKYKFLRSCCPKSTSCRQRKPAFSYTVQFLIKICKSNTATQIPASETTCPGNFVHAFCYRSFKLLGQGNQNHTTHLQLTVFGSLLFKFEIYHITQSKSKTVTKCTFNSITYRNLYLLYYFVTEITCGLVLQSLISSITLSSANQVSNHYNDNQA